MTSLLKQFTLQDRVAIVTGASRGIGRAVSGLLAEMGARVVVNYAHNPDAAHDLVETLKQKGTDSLAIQADVSNVAQAHQLVEETIKHFGRADILVCSAGIWEGSPVEQMTEDAWDRTIDINLKGTWAVCQAAVPAMKARLPPRRLVSPGAVSCAAAPAGTAGARRAVR